MTIAKLRRSFEERRLNLIETLRKNKESMEPAKQHQLYGAIKEIEYFLKTIDAYREEELQQTDFELRREAPAPVSSRAALAIQRMGENTKHFAGRTKEAVHKHVVQRTKRVVKRTKEKIQFIKDVAAEVKARSKKE